MTSRRAADSARTLCGLAVAGWLSVASVGAGAAQALPAVDDADSADDARPAAPAAGGGRRTVQEKPWRFRWDDHPALAFAGGTVVAFRARLQGHIRESDAPLGDASAFDLARRRIGVEGRIARVVDFEIDHELGHDEPWRDVYAEYRQFAVARVRAGKFKLPFSLDENTSATNLDFVYRSRAATQLAPGRDPGVMVSGRVARSVLRYEAGVFAHDGRNARTRNPDRVYGDRTLAGRLVVQPFRAARSALRDLQFGVAMTGSDVPEGMPGLRGRTALDASFYPADVWVQGHRRRTGLELRWRPGPFSVKSEYIRVSTERLGQSVDDGDLPPLIGSGWYVSGTWLATGERKASGAENPRRPLFRGGPGAIELAARLDALGFHSSSAVDPIPSSSPRAGTVLGNRVRAATFGVNWYPHRAFKVQGNIIREHIAEPAYSPLPTQPSYWSTALRFQLSI